MYLLEKVYKQKIMKGSGTMKETTYKGYTIKNLGKSYGYQIYENDCNIASAKNIQQAKEKINSIIENGYC